MYFGEGGFTHSDVYTMPTYLRNFYIKQLVKAKDAEKEHMEKANRSQSSSIPTTNPRFKR